MIRKLGVRIEDAMAQGVKELGFEPIDLARIGCHTQPDCRWEQEKIPATSKPRDWKTETVRINIQGDAVFCKNWQVFGTFAESDRMLTTEELAVIPDSLLINGQTVFPQKIRAENGVFDLNQVLSGKGEKRVAWVFTTLETTTGGLNSIGCGFDWWGSIWIDGKEIYATGEDGNMDSPATFFNHVCQVELTPGKHVVAVRFLTGMLTGTLSMGGGADLKEPWNEKYWWMPQ